MELTKASPLVQSLLLASSTLQKRKDSLEAATNVFIKRPPNSFHEKIREHLEKFTSKIKLEKEQIYASDAYHQKSTRILDTSPLKPYSISLSKLSTAELLNGIDLSFLLVPEIDITDTVFNKALEKIDKNFNPLAIL